MTTTIEVTKTTEIKVTKEEPIQEIPDTIIIKNARDRHVTFRCAHCGSVFSTTNWYRTRGRHYSAACPCCPYRAWAR